ncbi:MAG: hypothetical protein ACJA2Q_002268 [Pseudohongiellaceae bacterium]|jgi:hypothetical protein
MSVDLANQLSYALLDIFGLDGSEGRYFYFVLVYCRTMLFRRQKAKLYQKKFEYGGKV